MDLVKMQMRTKIPLLKDRKFHQFVHRGSRSIIEKNEKIVLLFCIWKQTNVDEHTTMQLNWFAIDYICQSIGWLLLLLGFLSCILLLLLFCLLISAIMFVIASLVKRRLPEQAHHIGKKNFFFAVSVLTNTLANEPNGTQKHFEKDKLYFIDCLMQCTHITLILHLIVFACFRLLIS